MVGIPVVLSALVFGPAVPQLASHFLGIEYVDAYGTQWFYWYVAEALSRGSLAEFAHTDLFFHPWGKDVFGHTGSNVLDAIVAVPMRAVLGNVLGYNVFVLLGLLATGLAAARLVGHFTPDRLSIAAASVCVALSPFALFELVEGRPTQAILVLPVLFAERVWVTGRADRWGPPVVAGLLLAAVGYQYWFYALFGGLACLGHGLARAISPSPGSGGRWTVLARHALIALVALICVAPVAVPLASAAADSGAVPGLLDTSTWGLSSSPPLTVEGTRVGLMLWQPFRAAHGVFAVNPDGSEVFLHTGRHTPWVVLPLLVLAAVRLGRSDRLALLLSAVFVAVVAAGPILLLGKTAFPNVAYLLLVDAFAFLRRLWWPGRAYAFFAIGTGIGVAVSLAAVKQRFGARAQQGAWLVLGLGWALHLSSESLVPFPRWSGAVPAGYRCLADGEDGALIELPYAWTQAHLYYQTHHGRPILGGMIENNPVFTPEESVELRTENAFVAAMLQLARLESEALPEWTTADQQAVRQLGYRYVVLQRDALDAQTDGDRLTDSARRTRLRRVERHLVHQLGEPVYRDARVAIYAPWGDPSPCQDRPPAPDTTALGKTDIDSADRVFKDLDAQGISRWPGAGD